MEELSTLEGDSVQQSEQDIKMGIFTIFRDRREYYTFEARLASILEMKRKKFQ